MDDKKLRELERILDEPAPNVIVNRDGSCIPVAVSDMQARALAEELLKCLEFQAVTEEAAGSSAQDGTCTVATFKLSDRGIALLAAEGLRQRLDEHVLTCTQSDYTYNRICSDEYPCSRRRDLQRQLAATQPGATGEEGQ